MTHDVIVCHTQLCYTAIVKIFHMESENVVRHMWVLHQFHTKRTQCVGRIKGVTCLCAFAISLVRYNLFSLHISVFGVRITIKRLQNCSCRKKKPVRRHRLLFLCRGMARCGFPPSPATVVRVHCPVPKCM